MVEYLESNEVINPTHHGFRYKRSTISQVLFFKDEDIISKLKNGDDVDAINILLHKIKALKIKGKILKWLQTFLKKRQQRVKRSFIRLGMGVIRCSPGICSWSTIVPDTNG